MTDDIKILIVEDNSNMSVILQTILRGGGYRDVRHVRNVVDAFELLRDYHADLILADMELGELSGLEFLQILRTSPDSPAPKTPLIMVTAHAARENVLSARRGGVDGFVVKPVSPRNLLARVHAVLSGRLQAEFL